MKRLLTLMALCVLTLSLAGCQDLSHDYRDDVYEYAMIADSGDLTVLDEYPNLEYVDLRGSTCYDEILDYAASHPSVTVRYNVSLGEKRVNQDVIGLSLYDYELDYDLLVENLQYLPKLERVTLLQTSLTAEEMTALREAYPDIAFEYTVEILSQEIPHDATTADLSFLTPEGVSEAANKLKLLPELEEIKLMNAYGNSSLSVSDVKTLVSAAPDAKFHYEFELFGQNISAIDEQLIFDSIEIGNEGVNQLRSALDIMNQCTYAKFDSCGIDDEIMAQLRVDYPQKKIVWRVFIASYSLLTDEEMVRMTSKLNDDNTGPLKYCTEVKYLDISNNRNVKDISFLASMPKLEAAVLSLTKPADLSPLAQCPNLTWLELTNCNPVADLSPLSGLQNLKYLNVAGTKVSELSCLDNLPLERFNCVQSKVGKSELADFEAKHPDCLTVAKGSTRGYGWRYDDTKGTLFSYYDHLRQIFRYDDKKFFGNKKET